MVKITVDEKKCIGCGACEAACGEVFKLEETKDGYKAKVKAQKDLPCVKEAADACPVDAIKVSK